MADKIPIDWLDVARQSGKMGKLHLFKSTLLNEWVVENGCDPHLAVIKAPEGAVRIEDGFWIVAPQGEKELSK